MSLIPLPKNDQPISEDDTATSLVQMLETSEIAMLKDANLRLKTHNRWLRNVIKLLEQANTENGVEKDPPASMNVGIFAKIGPELNLSFTPIQRVNYRVWTAAMDAIAHLKLDWDLSGAEEDREKYEAAINEWRAAHIRRDDIDIIICQRVVAERMTQIIEEHKDAISKLKTEVKEKESEAKKLKSEMAGDERRLRIQSDVVKGLQQREKFSEAEIRTKHEKEVNELHDIIEELREKEKMSAAEMESMYEKKLKEQNDVIADLQRKEKLATQDKKNHEKHLKDKTSIIAREMRQTYEAKVKEQNSIIKNFQRGHSTTAELRKSYENKLAEQNSIIEASAEEMVELRRELAAHSEISINIINRKRELMKPFESRSDHVVEMGNLSAHCGTCLADLYRIKSNIDVNDSPWFVELYGVALETVERFAGSTAFVKLVNMRYDIYQCKTEHQSIASEFENGFQSLMIGILNGDVEGATPDSVNSYLLQKQKEREIFQRLCSIWDTTRAAYKVRSRESRDPRRRSSIFGGSMRSGASVMTGETQTRSKLDKIEEYGKDFLASAKDAMLWNKS